MIKNNIKLYQESRKVDQEAYVTPYEDFATDFYRSLIIDKIKDKNAKILDIGCFKGILVDKLRDYKSFGLDVTSLGFLKPGRYVVGSAEVLPFKTNSLDCIVMSEVIEHIYEPTVVYKEIHRMLKDGGYFLVTHPNKYNFLDTLIENIKENTLVRKLLKRPIYKGVQHVQAFYYSDTINNLKPLNFTVQSCHAITFSLHRIFSMFLYGRLKCELGFKIVRAIIKLEYSILNFLGKAGLPFAGSCILLFKVSKNGA